MEKIINSKILKSIFKSIDVVIRPIKITQNNITVHIFGVDGLINTELFDRAILQSFKFDKNLNDCRTERAMMDYLLSGGAYHVFTKEETDMDLLLRYVLSGMIGIIFDQEQKAIIYDIRSFEKRSISEPAEE